MKSRIKGMALAIIAACSFALAGCATQDSSGGVYTAGTYTASADGYGGTVTVTVKVSANDIVSIKAEGASETQGIGSVAIEELPGAIVKAGVVEVESVSGASFSSAAVKKAAAAALDAARKDKAAVSAVMADGTYEASAWGFGKTMQLPVSVTVANNAIEAIAVGSRNGETGVILRTAIERLIPRMIEAQSIAVDAITGATASSNAIKAATREALSKALAAGGSAPEAIAAFEKKPVKKIVQAELETDVLVIGLGGSGMSAAMSAAQAGVSVLGIEKAAKIGGTSALTSSPMAINPPSMVEERGSDFVDVPTMRADWLEYTRGDAKAELVDVMMSESGPVLDWMMSLGFKFQKPITGFGTPYECVAYYGSGLGESKENIGGFFSSMLKAYETAGGRYLLEVEGTDLILDKSGKVIGATAIGVDGTSYTIKAKAVILAGGGFAGNPEMEERYLHNEYYPLKGAWKLYGSAQNDGKTIAMALDAGAGTYNISVPPMVHIGGTEQIIHDYPVHVVEGRTDMWTGLPATWSLNDVPMAMALAPDTIAVGPDGRRFSDESALWAMNAWMAGPRFYSLWSEARVRAIAEKGFEYAPAGLFVNQGGVPAGVPVPEIADIMELMVKKGMAYRADTLAALAKQIGVKPAVLERSVASYNEYCATGEPGAEIPKADGVYSIVGERLADANYLKGIGSEGPFYAVVGAPWSYSTAGGLDVDADMRVLKKGGKAAIPGLYAVGTDSIGVILSEQVEYVKYGGAAQGWAFTSGKIAGDNAASYIKK